MLILDNEKPVFARETTNITVNTDPGLPTSVVTWDSVTATDNSGLVTLASNYQSGIAFSIGDTNVIYTAIDPSGNLNRTMFTVTVKGMVVIFILSFFLMNYSSYGTVPNLVQLYRIRYIQSHDASSRPNHFKFLTVKLQ